jgi:hypothetical protein
LLIQFAEGRTGRGAPGGSATDILYRTSCTPSSQIRTPRNFPQIALPENKKHTDNPHFRA